MDTLTIYKPPIHKHPLFPSSRFISSACGGCRVYGYMHGYYFCNDPYCDARFHKKCVEAPLEINHPSHPQHPLMLTTYSGDAPCDLCGQDLYGPFYSCSTCDFKVELSCGMKPSPPPIEHLPCHDHSLVFLKKKDDEYLCELCKESIGGVPSYSCLECKDIYFHVECIRFSKEVNHPCHPNHPLKLISSNTLMNDAEMCCLSCGISIEKVMYHCFICNFSMCLVCTRDPPPLVIEHFKTHKHPLNFFPRRVPYTCDVCGLAGSTFYICLQCYFVIHAMCIDLPQVINTNRHNHRIYFTHHLGVGYSKCGVCRQSLSRYHAAYYCSICPNYAVHSACAIKSDVWDGVELAGTPNDTEDIAPFKVVGESLISHFSHEKHTLRLYKNNAIDGKWLRCEACIHPVGFDSIYGCEECDFFLHEKCANLPRKKRIVYDIVPYTLEVVVGGVGACKLCRTLSDGFKYTSQDERLTDVHCGSLIEPLIHHGHLDPLYFYLNDGHRCNGCDDMVDGYVFHCDACDFYLCFYCACLPEKIWHWSDEHHLTLYCGGRESDTDWCDNCENELDSSKWFYTCFVCGVTLHARCVLGDFSRLKLESIIDFCEKRFEVVANHNTRPFCSQCHSRCKISPYLKVYDENNVCICSLSCLVSYTGLIMHV